MRVFVAVEISNPEILKNIQKFQNTLKINAKRTRIDQIHFTLQFIGEINQKKVELIKQALMTLSFSKFELTVMHSGAFPNPKNPRVVRLGVDKNGEEKISSLANDVNNVLGTIGLKNEKPFKPHLTIFRVKNRIGDITSELLKFKDVKFGKQMISKIVLK